MKRVFAVAAAVMFLFPALCTAGAVTKEEILEYLNWEELKTSFSARHTSTLTGTAKSVSRNSKIYKRGAELLRIETEPTMLKALAKSKGKKPLGDLVMIRNLEKKTAYLVFPARKSYVAANTDQLKMILEQIGGGLQQKVDLKAPKIKNFEKLGTEKIEGISCEKVHCRVPLKNGGESDVTAWLATDYNNLPLKTIIKTTAASGAVLQRTSAFKDLKRMPPPNRLFDVPSDYTRYKNLVQLASEGKAGQNREAAKTRAKERRKRRRGAK